MTAREESTHPHFVQSNKINDSSRNCKMGKTVVGLDYSKCGWSKTM